MRKYVVYYLMLAPLIDYTYRMKYRFGADTELSLNRIYKFIPIVIFLIFLFRKPKDLVLWKYPFWILAAALISCLIGIYSYPFDAFDTYVRLFSSIALIFLAGKYISDRDIHRLFHFLLIVTLIPIVVSILQVSGYITYTDFDYIGGISLGRVSGGYEKQVSMMAYLLYTFPFALYSFAHEERVFQKIGYSAYILLCFGVILLSTHRISIIIFTGITFYMTYKYSRKVFVSFALLIAAIVVAYREFLADVFLVSSGLQNLGSDIGRGRIGMWSDYLQHFFRADLPTLLIGKGTPVFDTSKGEFVPYLWNEPHSDIVRILYEYGFVGWTLFFSMLAVAIRKSVSYRRANVGDGERFIGDIGIVTGFALLGYSISIEPSRFPSFWWYYSVVISYILFQTFLRQQESTA